MTMSNRPVVVGVFADRRNAEQAVSALRSAGFREDQIGVVTRDENGVKGTAAKQTKEKGSKMEEGATTGLVAGAGVGALWGLGIVAGLLPAIGPIIAGGVLASILASAAGGAAVAGIVGGLIGLGIPEDEAQYYEGEFKSGRTIVTVKGNGRQDEALAIIQQHGGYDMHSAERTPATGTGSPASSRSTATRAPAASLASSEMGASGRTGAEQTVQLREEEIHARKQPVQTGEVKVRKEVITEQRSIEVPVEREEVVIERRPVSGPARGGDLRAEEIRIPVKEEQVRVEKDMVVKEEVKIGKRKVQDTEQVAATVRKEQLRVESEGDANVRNTGTGSTAPRGSQSTNQ